MTKRYAVQDQIIDSLIDLMLDKEPVFRQARRINDLLDEALEGLDIYRDKIALLEGEIEKIKTNSGSALGSIRTPKKALSSAKNGKKGGRPKKVVLSRKDAIYLGVGFEETVPFIRELGRSAQ